MRSTTTMVLIGVSVGLAGCIQSRLHLTDDYGRAVRQDVAAQIDDPDAKYVGIPEGGAHGRVAGAAIDRYVSGKVKEPPSTKTSDVAAGSGGGGQ